MLKSNYNDLALLLTRIGFGGLMLINHGIPKLDKLNGPIEFADPIGVGATASLILCLIGEFLAPVLIIIGLKTKLAAIPAAITMGVAAFMAHASDPWKAKELAIVYMFGYVFLFISGPGKFSVDAMISKK